MRPAGMRPRARVSLNIAKHRFGAGSRVNEEGAGWPVHNSLTGSIHSYSDSTP